MKKLYIVMLILLLSATMVFAGGGQEAKKTDTAKAAVPAFPEKPIKLVVYLAPGGAGDILARKFTDVASKYSDATFVVENKPGAGGIVALEYIRSLPSDGYNLMYVTKSIVSKVATTETDIDITKEYDWIAMLQVDPECVITNVKNKANTWEQIFEDSKAKNGNQLWLGPAAGGLDHVTAQKIWASAGMQAKWVPFDSGAKAIAALLGQQGVALFMLVTRQKLRENRILRLPRYAIQRGFPNSRMFRHSRNSVLTELKMRLCGEVLL